MSFSLSGAGKPGEAKESIKSSAAAIAASLKPASAQALDAVVNGVKGVCNLLPPDQRVSITASGHFNDDGSGSAGINISLSAPAVAPVPVAPAPAAPAPAAQAGEGEE